MYVMFMVASFYFSMLAFYGILCLPCRNGRELGQRGKKRNAAEPGLLIYKRGEVDGQEWGHRRGRVRTYSRGV